MPRWTPSASIGAFAVVGAEAPGSAPAPSCTRTRSLVPAPNLGADCVVHAHVSIRERCRLGARVIVQNGAVIGSDGYGFATRSRRHAREDSAGRRRW